MGRGSTKVISPVILTENCLLCAPWISCLKIEQFVSLAIDFRTETVYLDMSVHDEEAPQEDRSHACRSHR